MKPNVMLTIASLVSIVLMTFHFTDDVLREGGMAAHGASNLIAVLILFVWLYSPSGDRGTSSCSSDRCLRPGCPSST